ncbi:MAG: DNA cytosine methyltransferase [Methanobacteriaceae archaeon]|nr:DNA cytosine methyltransferase [Methanobacteriaceae archaeon]
MINLEQEYKNSLKNISFIDLFSGIGGFKLALESFGANCIYSIDIDKHASLTYEKKFWI